MGNRPSFPTAGGDVFRGYTRDDIFRADTEEEEEEFPEEVETETEAPLEIDINAEETLHEEPDLADEN